MRHCDTHDPFRDGLDSSDLNPALNNMIIREDYVRTIFSETTLEIKIFDRL